jgi:hypothetical protein
MTHVTTITLKLNLADEEGTILVGTDTNTASMARLATYLQTIIPTLDTLQCADAINVTEICMESCISGIWIVENERMGYELVTTYHYEIEISVRHIGQCLSNSIISRMVGAILEAGADASYVSEENLDTSYHVSYPVDWFATQSPSLLIDDREAVGYCGWDDRDTDTDTDTETQDDDDEDDVSEYPDYKNCTHDFPFMNLTKEEGKKKSDAFNFDRYRPIGAFAIMCNACHKRYTDYEGLCETV